jgi:hypothetical protein
MHDSPVVLIPFDIEQFRKIFKEAIQDSDILDAEQKSVADANRDTFDWIMDYLRSDFPDKETNSRFSLLWDLIGNKYNVVVSATNLVPEVICGMHGAPPTIIILLPEDFYNQFKADMLHQVGLIVHAGFCAMYYLRNWLTFIQFPDDPIVTGIGKAAIMEEGRVLWIYQTNNPTVAMSPFHLKLIDDYLSNKPD